MQTFLPYPSFARSAAVLDNRRLGKQRVEALQILRALHLEDYGWARHPAVLMWRGHALALVAYGLAVVDEWRGRGFGDTTAPSIAEFACPRPAVRAERLPEAELPPWLGWEALHRSHRAALVRKDPGAYGEVFAGTPPDLPYAWPDSPAGPPPQRPFAAWVVRPTSSQAEAEFAERGLVGLPTSLGGPDATRKRRAQLGRLREDVRARDRVVIAHGAELGCGTIVGPPGETCVAEVAHVAVPVAWDRTVPRSALLRPYQLQDPQLLFALRGEMAVAG